MKKKIVPVTQLITICSRTGLYFRGEFNVRMWLRHISMHASLSL